MARPGSVGGLGGPDQDREARVLRSRGGRPGDTALAVARFLARPDHAARRLERPQLVGKAELEDQPVAGAEARVGPKADAAFGDVHDTGQRHRNQILVFQQRGHRPSRNETKSGPFIHSLGADALRRGASHHARPGSRPTGQPSKQATETIASPVAGGQTSRVDPAAGGSLQSPW